MTNRLTETPDRMIIHLRQPFWGAWKTYGWEKGIEGFGISAFVLNKAKNFDKIIQVKYKYGNYEIAWTKCYDFIRKQNCQFTAREGTILYIFPRTLFTRVKTIKTNGNKKA